MMNSLNIISLLGLIWSLNAYSAHPLCQLDRMNQATADEIYHNHNTEQVNAPLCAGHNTLLHVAILAGADAEVIQELVDMGANVHSANKMGQTP